MKRLAKKKSVTSVASISSAVRLAVRSVRSRKIPNGISGSRVRRSMSTNTSSRTATMARLTIVRADVHPSVTVWPNV